MYPGHFVPCYPNNDFYDRSGGPELQYLTYQEAKQLQNQPPYQEQEEEEQSSVDIDKKSCKSRLKCAWSFWSHRKTQPDSKWTDDLILQATVEYADDFWSVFDSLSQINTLCAGTDYMVFREGVKPMWEDKNNQEGGRWAIKYNKLHYYNEINALWEYTLDYLVFSGDDEVTSHINGAVISVKQRISKLAFWTKDSSNFVRENMGQLFRKNPYFLNISFEVHRRQDIEIKGNSKETEETDQTSSSKSVNALQAAFHLLYPENSIIMNRNKISEH